MKSISEFQKEVSKLIFNSTKSNRILFKIISYEMSEDVEIEETLLNDCLIKVYNLPDSKEEETILSFNSKGKGFVDALFKGLLKEFDLFSTLSDFIITNFKIVADTKKDKSSTEGEAIAQLTVYNKINKKEFIFHSSKVFSINLAAIEVIVQALEFFVNSEQAVKMIYYAFKDAKRRHRTDLVESFTKQLVL
jgi:hypothetical protein